jgi:hypothetical protein
MPRVGLWLVTAGALACAPMGDPPEPLRPPAAQSPSPVSQNPSPMVERTRAHERITDAQWPGLRFGLEGVLQRPVHVFVPAGVEASPDATLLVHFHGAPHIAEHAVATAGRPYVLAVVQAGAGTGSYERAFEDPAAFDALLVRIGQNLAPGPGDAVAFGPVVVSAFSAGHGAVRALLREPRHFARIDGALLLDGIHTGYIPPGRVLHEGGALDPVGLAPYEALARAALHGEKVVVITHSTIFPGTFASTTETADHLLDALGLHRTAVLRWGPVGMQQLSDVAAGGLRVLGFAGNTAPDHMDHLHGMAGFLRLLEGQD